jgi:hypothetical protein
MVSIPRARTASELEAAVNGAAAIAKLQPKENGAVSLVSSLSTPLELWDVGKAAFGGGQAGPALQVLGGVHVAIGAYKSVKGLATRISPQAVNDALKSQTGGRDLDPADAQALADKINARAKINSSISLANYVASGAAIYTGSVGAGLIALALKVGEIGSAVYSSAQTVKDIKTVLDHTAPAPQPAPPTPAPAPQP